MNAIGDEMRKMIAGTKVFFRNVEEDDLPMRVRWINDPDIQKTLHFNYPTSLARTKRWLDKASMNDQRVDFTIYETSTQKRIGFCGFINIDYLVRKAEMYAAIGEKQYWRGGYGTESYILLINYGFQELGMNKAYGYQNTDNSAALHIVKKLGWTLEGTLRQDVFAHGRLYDRNVISILRNEWEKNVIYDIG